MKTEPDWADLESPVCELADMVELATHYAEGTICAAHTQKIALTDRESDLIMFGIYKIGNMVRELKADFYARLERDDRSEVPS